MTERLLQDRPPVIVFGTGGSGTRVVARILSEAGCFIGNNLNGALDSMDFGFLLAGRVDWMEKHFPFEGDSAQIYLRIFKKVFFQQRLTLLECLRLIQNASQYLFGRSRISFERRPLSERIQRGLKLIAAVTLPARQSYDHFQGWGFKSPEAIYFVEPLIRFFLGVKFIHVIRDGRDMAVSRNRNPLQYACIFQISEADPVRAAFDNWCAVNTWAHERCKFLLPETRYLMIKYEDICRRPAESVDTILQFSELGAADMERLYRLPKPNPTIQRWKNHQGYFRDVDREALRRFGYSP